MISKISKPLRPGTSGKTLKIFFESEISITFMLFFNNSHNYYSIT
jgi:hypothetical protein